MYIPYILSFRELSRILSYVKEKIVAEMKNNRWYDNNSNLKTIVESLRDMDRNVRDAFALDIIQSAISKQSDKDTFLTILNNNEPLTIGKRWYDREDLFQSAVEMLKFLQPHEIEELFKDAMISIIYEDEDIPRQ